MNVSKLRTRWAAVGAAVAVTIGAGGIGISAATSPTGAAAYVPITPCRLADTRPAPDTVGPSGTPIVAGSPLTVLARGDVGNCTAANGNSLPASATGLQLNVTGLGASSPTFVTVWPTGATQPVTSNLNLVPGAAPTPNAVTVGLSADGTFTIANGIGSVNVIVDVVGYYTDHQHTGADIVDNSLTAVDIQNEPGIADGFSGNVTTPITPTPSSVGSVSIRPPADGYVMIDATGLWLSGDISGPPPASDDAMICQIQKGTVTVLDATQSFGHVSDYGATESGWNTFSLHRIFPIAVADNPVLRTAGQVFNVMCDELAGNVSVEEVYVTATYFSSTYEATGLVVFPFSEATQGGQPPAAGTEG